MPDVTARSLQTRSSPLLSELQATLEREIPMSAQMGIRVSSVGTDGLATTMPLAPNHNHQQSAFAGSLNALCTVAGWGSIYVLLRELNRDGNIVIRRSTIRYHRPVVSPEIVAHCQPVAAESIQYFLEMLDEKRQAKLDLVVEVPGSDGPAVMFHGSYVVLASGCQPFGVPF